MTALQAPEPECPLQIEADVQLARLLAGLHGSKARKEVSERANSILEAGLHLLLDEDILTARMEAAQACGFTPFDIHSDSEYLSLLNC